MVNTMTVTVTNSPLISGCVLWVLYYPWRSILFYNSVTVLRTSCVFVKIDTIHFNTSVADCLWRKYEELDYLLALYTLHIFKTTQITVMELMIMGNIAHKPEWGLPVTLPACRQLYLPAYLHVCLPACLTSCMPTCLPTCMYVCLHDWLPVCMPTCQHACLSAYMIMNVYLSSCLPACITTVWLSACMYHYLSSWLLALHDCLYVSVPTCLPTYISICLPTCSWLVVSFMSWQHLSLNQDRYRLVHSWQLYSASPLGKQAASIIIPLSHIILRLSQPILAISLARKEQVKTLVIGLTRHGFEPVGSNHVGGWWVSSVG